MEPGEIWWAQFEEKRLVVLLSADAGSEFLAMQIVEPATSAQKLGFVLMSGEQAVDADQRRRILEEAGTDPRAVGIEVFFGAEEGLAKTGVVRVALPKEGKIFCTWETTVSEESLVDRVGVLSPAKHHELEVALALAGGSKPLSPGLRGEPRSPRRPQAAGSNPAQSFQEIDASSP